jgi:hypothetical protein
LNVGSGRCLVRDAHQANDRGNERKLFHGGGLRN